MNPDLCKRLIILCIENATNLLYGTGRAGGATASLLVAKMLPVFRPAAENQTSDEQKADDSGCSKIRQKDSTIFAKKS
jgi:hypothetical protein